MDVETKSKQEGCTGDAVDFINKIPNKRFALIFTEEKSGWNCEDWQNILQDHMFDVRVHDVDEIETALKEVSKYDHCETECILVIVETQRNIDEFYEEFAICECEPLVSVPKVLVIEGPHREPEDSVTIDGIAGKVTQAVSFIPGSVTIYKAFNNKPELGANFCKGMEKEDKKKDVIKMLTSAGRRAGGKIVNTINKTMKK